MDKRYTKPIQSSAYCHTWKPQPTFQERCESHPEHQTGMVTHEMIEARLREESEDLRAENERLRAEVNALRDAGGEAMTRDDIMRLAQESELWNVITQHSCEYGDGLPTLDYYHELERFANLVAAAERERFVAYPAGDVTGPCVCGSWPGGECLRCDVTDGAAAAIRARGEQ